jgi:hypothetical protein
MNPGKNFNLFEKMLTKTEETTATTLTDASSKKPFATKSMIGGIP